MVEGDVGRAGGASRINEEVVGIASYCYNERNPIFIRRERERLTSNKHQNIPRVGEDSTIVNKTLQKNKSWEEDNNDGRGEERHDYDENNRGNKQKTNQITSHCRNPNGICSEQFVANSNNNLNNFRNSIEAVASPLEGLVSLTRAAASPKTTTPSKQPEDKFPAINNNRTRMKQGRGWESEERINSGYDVFHSNVPNVLMRYVCLGLLVFSWLVVLVISLGIINII